MFNDNHNSVPVMLTTRYNRIHQGKINCWFYETVYGNDTLLGTREDYQIYDLMEL